MQLHTNPAKAICFQCSEISPLSPTFVLWSRASVTTSYQGCTWRPLQCWSSRRMHELGAASLLKHTNLCLSKGGCCQLTARGSAFDPHGPKHVHLMNPGSSSLQPSSSRCEQLSLEPTAPWGPQKGILWASRWVTGASAAWVTLAFQHKCRAGRGFERGQVHSVKGTGFLMLLLAPEGAWLLCMAPWTLPSLKPKSNKIHGFKTWF